MKLKSSMVRRWMACWPLVVLSVGLGVESAVARPARVILLRHAEKPEQPSAIQLSETGRTRAEKLVSFFADELGVSRQSPPAALFATRPTRGAPSIRSRQTLEPLAAAVGLPVLQPWRADDFAQLARHLLESPLFDGQTVVVCWVHDELDDLARALGAKPKPKNWKGNVYDQVWVLSFTPEKVRCETLLQRLLPGDRTTD